MGKKKKKPQIYHIEISRIQDIHDPWVWQVELEGVAKKRVMVDYGTTDSWISARMRAAKTVRLHRKLSNKKVKNHWHFEVKR